MPEAAACAIGAAATNRGEKHDSLGRPTKLARQTKVGLLKKRLILVHLTDVLCLLKRIKLPWRAPPPFVGASLAINPRRTK